MTRLKLSESTICRPRLNSESSPRARGQRTIAEIWQVIYDDNEMIALKICYKSDLISKGRLGNLIQFENKQAIYFAFFRQI